MDEPKDYKIERQKYQLHKKGYEDITKAISELKEKPEVQKVQLLGAELITIKGEKGDKPSKEELEEIINPLIPTEEDLKKIVKPLIPSPIPGKDGKDYVLTEANKTEIASKITVPIVEKIIEKTETIIEKPTITEITKEVAKYEDTEAIVNKLKAHKKKWLSIDAIDGDFNTKIRQIGNKVVGISSLKHLTDVDYSGLSQDANGNYILGSGGGSSVWGGITGTLSDQTDLQSALDAKGTYTLPSLTSGSVLFSDGTTIAQDNANFFWDNTNNRLGIGTTSPQAELDLNGGDLDLSGVSGSGADTKIHGGSNSRATYINMYNSVSGGIDFYNLNGTATSTLYGGLTVTGVLSTNQDFTLASGKALLGANSSSILPYDSSTGNMILKASTVSVGISKIRFFTGTSSTERMTILGTGEVGIGTINPRATLHSFLAGGGSSYGPTGTTIIGQNSTSGNSSYLTLVGGYDAEAGIVFTDESQAYKGKIGYSNSSEGMYFNTDGSEKMRILSTGNVGIGGTPSYPLDVITGTSFSNGGIRTKYALRFGTNTSSAPVLFSFSGSSQSTPNEAGQGLSFYSYANTNGNIGIAFTGDSVTTTASSYVNAQFVRGFLPSSGNADFTTLNVRPTINQTGGANGITRGIYINPTLTSAADFRAIQLDNSSGYGIYQSNAGASNYFAGDVSVPDEVYGAGWNGNTEVPTKNAVYDKIEGLSSVYQPLDTQLTSVAGLSYTGNALKVVRVNAGETDFELATISVGGGTVTNTGGNLIADSVVLGAGTVDTKVVAGITSDGTSQLNLGVNATTLGKLKLFGNTSGDVTIQPNAIAGTGIVLTAPATTGTLALTSDITGTNSNTNTGDQTITNSSDATSHTVTLSASGGSVQLIEGSNITLTTGGTGSAGTVTIAASGGGLSWGSSISGTTADGVTVTMSNSANDGASALKLIGGNTQTNQSALANLQLGTSGNVQGLLIQGTGSGTLGAVGTGANHLTLWGDTASNDNIVFAVGNEVSFTEHFNIRAHGGMTTDWGTIPANPSFRYGWNITVGDAGGNNSSGIRQTWGNTQTNTGGMANLVQVGTSAKVTGLVVRGTLGGLGSDYTSEGTGVYVHGNTASQNKQAFATGNEAVPSTTWYVSTAGQTVQNLVIATTSANNVTLPNSVTSAKAGYEVTLGNTQANSPYGFLANVGTSAKVTGTMIKGTFGTATTGLTSAFTAWGNTASQATRAIAIGNGTSFTETAFINTDGKATLVDLTTTGNIELGHATDTTISRVSAGVISVEGVTVPTISSTNTLTNKRIQPRTASSTSNANLSPDLSTANVYYRTTQTATLTIDAPTGTPVIGETIMIYVDSAGSQTLTINGTYVPFGAAFPATTTAGKTFMMSCQYNGSAWNTLWANKV